MEVEAARQILIEFNDPWHLAHFFKSEQIQGKPSLSDSCPIAKWMQAKTGKNINVSQGWMWDADEDDCERQHLKHTDTMHEFTILFDSNHFPELETPYNEGEAWIMLGDEYGA